MYLIGNKIDSKKFKFLYAIFQNNLTLSSYLKNNDIIASENLIIQEFSEFDFPFFIFEELSKTNHHYYPISKDELKSKIKSIHQLNDFETIYFNLWRIDDNGYNVNFPDEPFLNGRDRHLHFTDHDLQQISIDGFNQYWNDTLEA